MKITCPYCFEQFAPNKALFRCRNVAKCSGTSADTVYSNFRNINPPETMGCTFEAPRTLWLRGVCRVANCPDCQQETRKRICPNCHQELSHDAGLLPERMIAVIGARASGKSNFIAVLIHELRHRVLPNFKDAYLQIIGDTTARRYHDDFEAYVYGEKSRQVPPTQSATAQDANVRIPLIYRLKFGNKAVNLVLFDTAGEDMNSLDVLSTEARYITRADGLLFLLDPTQNRQVRQQLGGTLTMPFIDDAEPIVIIDRLHTLYEKVGSISINKKIKKPIAFTLAKIDVIESILPAGSILHRNSEHFDHLAIDDIEAVHAELQSLMVRWGIHNTIVPNFSNFRYFGVSAFGGVPNADGALDVLAPKRVEDPILWLLSEMNIVKKG